MKRNREYTCSRTEEQAKYQCYSDSHDQKNVVLSVIKHFFNLYLQFLAGIFYGPEPGLSGSDPDPIRIFSRSGSGLGGKKTDPDPDRRTRIRNTDFNCYYSPFSISRRGEM